MNFRKEEREEAKRKRKREKAKRRSADREVSAPDQTTVPNDEASRKSESKLRHLLSIFNICVKRNISIINERKRDKILLKLKALDQEKLLQIL